MKKRYWDLTKYGGYFFIIVTLYVIASYGVSPYLSFLSFAAPHSLQFYSITGGNVSQPSDHPIFNPGNITFSSINVPRGSVNIYSLYDTDYSSDFSSVVNYYTRHANNFVGVFGVLSSNNSASSIEKTYLVDMTNPANVNSNLNDAYWSNGMHNGGSDNTEYTQYALLDANLPSSTFFLNDSGLYHFKIISMTMSGYIKNYIQSNGLSSVDEEIPNVVMPGNSYYGGQEYKRHVDGGVYKYYCYNSSVSQNAFYHDPEVAKDVIVFDNVQPSDSFNGNETQFCESKNLSSLESACVSPKSYFDYDNNNPALYSWRCGYWAYSGENISISKNGSLNQDYYFEIKPDYEVLQGQLIQLRNIDDVEINQLMEKLNDENMTADQLQAAMEEYKTLLENKTDARLVEKLILLRYDFEYQLKKYQENDSSQYQQLMNTWGETIPLLQLDVTALREKQAALQDKVNDLEKRIELLEQENDTAGVGNLTGQLNNDKSMLNDLNSALGSIGWNSLPDSTKNLILLSLGGLLIHLVGFIRTKRIIIK